MSLLSAVVAVSRFTLALAFALASVTSASFCPSHRTKKVCCPWTSSCLVSCFRRLLCHSSPSPRCHTSGPFDPFLPIPLQALYPFQAIAPVSSYDVSLLVSESLCVLFASCVPLAQVRRQQHSIDDDLSFSMISSNFLGPVKNSRLISFGIISLTTNVFCASSIALN